jgi:predicted MFS family arabinose efflux permease
VGIWSGASAATTILGPLVGGLLVDGVSWRAVFLVNLPLVAVALWGLRRVPESRDERHPGRFDWLGAVLVALAVGGLSFGAIFGEQRQWRDPTAFAALGLGALCAVALPFYFARVRAPLVPLELFRSRAFSVVNLSTLVIYGALYVALFYQPLMLQTTLGYTAAGAGLAGLPTSLFLVFFSTRFGRLAARHGARRFMTAGPLVMAAGLLWFARLPGDSDPWLVGGDPATWLPPADYVVDVLPAVLFFGFGLTMLVAPLVTALLASIPARNAGLGSAINNAISRVGPQLVGAIVFIAITASFYTGLAARVPGLDPDSGEVRRRFAPLNAPAPDATPAEVGAARAASTDAFHLAMLVSAAFLAVGAVVNGAGLRDEPPTDEAGAVEAAAAAAG